MKNTKIAPRDKLAMERNADRHVATIKIVYPTNAVSEEHVELFAVPTVNVVKTLFARIEFVKPAVAMITTVPKIKRVSTSNAQIPARCRVSAVCVLNVTSLIMQFNATAHKE